MALWGLSISFFDMRHDRLRIFAAYASQIQPVITYATAGVRDCNGWHGRNRLPQHRLIVVLHAPKDSENWIVHHRDEGELDHRIVLQSGYAYFMPRQADLTFKFSCNLDVIAIHFTIEPVPGFDLFAQQDLCCKQELPKDLLILMSDACYQHRAHPTDTRHIVSLQAILMFGLSRLDGLSFPDHEDVFLRHVRWSTFVEHVDLHLSADLRIRHLAQKFNELPDTLSRRFKRDFGISLKKWLNQRLLQRAMNAIQADSCAIHEISERLGFSSEFHFSRFVRRETGQAPTTIRKRLFS